MNLSSSPQTSDSAAHELYRSDTYLDKHPTLFREHTAWKLSYILPMLDDWVSNASLKKDLSLLDVGGGAGILLRETAQHLRTRHHRSVTKYAIDLSPGMLAEQKRTNPDLHEALEQDISKTALPDKSMDLTLLIDVLEHIPDPAAALQELARVSRYVFLKVPLENHLIHHLSNAINRGHTRRAHAEALGHVNFYTAGSLRRQVQKHLGTILQVRYCDIAAFTLRHESHRLNPRLKQITRLDAAIHRLSPALASRFYTGAQVLLVKCHQ